MLYRHNERDSIRELLDIYREMQRAAKHREVIADKTATAHVAETRANVSRQFGCVLPVLFDVATLYFGDPIANAVVRTYGKADAIDSIAPENVVDCAAQFLRLTDPWLLKPRPRAKLAPYNAANPTDARIAKLEFAEAERQRVLKAKALWLKLQNAVAPFDSVSAWYDFDLPHVPPQLDDYLATGLTRMTVGSFKDPCPRGLTELESFLKLPIGSARMHRVAVNLRKRKAVAWKLFDEFADKRLATLNGGQYNQLMAATRIAGKHRKVYPGQARDVFDDQRNRPDSVSLEQFGDLKNVYVELIDDWFDGPNRKRQSVTEFG